MQFADLNPNKLYTYADYCKWVITEKWLVKSAKTVGL